MPTGSSGLGGSPTLHCAEASLDGMLQQFEGFHCRALKISHSIVSYVRRLATTFMGSTHLLGFTDMTHTHADARAPSQLYMSDSCGASATFRSPGAFWKAGQKTVSRVSRL